MASYMEAEHRMAAGAIISLVAQLDDLYIVIWIYVVITTERHGTVIPIIIL